MRFLIFISLLFSVISLMGSSVALSTEMPSVELSSKILGGTVLLIEMKYSLMINGDTQTKLIHEIGKTNCENLFHDMIMTKSPQYLREKYANENKLVTHSLIDQYAVLLSSKNMALK